MSKKNNAAPAPQSFLQGLGVEVSEVGTPFWKPDGRKRTVTVLNARAPTPEERIKQLPDDKGELTIYVVLDVQLQGVEHRWEVSSKRLLAALDAVLVRVPMDLDVQQHGSGQTVSFTVEPTPAKLAKGSLSEPCEAPGCIYSLGHHGAHSTKGSS